jgi:Ras-related protein Rab-8A
MSAPAGKREVVDAQLKLLIIGDTAVGKTSLLLRYNDDKFATSFVSTLGIDFKTKVVDLDGQKVRLQIWDTAGQERFRTITTSYFRGAHGILLAFDATERKTFATVGSWMSQIAEHADEGVACMLVATKADMTDRIQVPDKEAEALAAQHGLRYLPTSAKLNSNVKESFETLARLALKKANADTAARRAAGGGGDSAGATIKPSAKDKGGAGGGCAC